MTKPIVNGTHKPRGKWVRSMGMRYWEGPCTCGSGREGHEVYDDHGIYFGITCTKCNRYPTPGYMHEEQIEPDDGERW
jgi:hypothetical protein